MKNSRALATLVATALAAGTTALAGTPVRAADTGKARAAADGVVAEGLEDPFSLSKVEGGFVVTETGAGQVVRIDKGTGRTRTIVDGLGPYVASAAVKVRGKYAVVTGEADPSSPVPGSSVLIAASGGAPTQLADLLAYELENNPDGQTQFGPGGESLDTLSNPFGVLTNRANNGFVLVADGGANDVLRVNRRGVVSTFFVPPTVNTGACEGLPNNDENTVGCDAVPTGLAYGPDHTVYISALTAEVPGEGRVYVVDKSTGDLERVYKGFHGPTGVTVDQESGTFYVSELLEGAPAGPPGPGFDPSTVGQIVKVRPGGARSYAQVTMPIGLVLAGGELYSTAWSVAGLFLGATGMGQVVRVDQGDFEGAAPAARSAARPSGLGDGLTMRGIR